MYYETPLAEVGRCPGRRTLHKMLDRTWMLDWISYRMLDAGLALDVQWNNLCTRCWTQHRTLNDA